jgi:hypothetical protein
MAPRVGLSLDVASLVIYCARLAYMSAHDSQLFWEPAGSTIRLPRSTRLAPLGQERRWLRKGLVRFANCEDSNTDYKALGRAFPDFWPLTMMAPRSDASSISRKMPRTPADINRMNREHYETDVSLAWHPACHKVFLFYRDRLRDIWNDGADEPLKFWMPEFLLGISRQNEHAFDNARQSLRVAPPLTALGNAFSEVLMQFPKATCPTTLRVGMLWNRGDFYILPENGFQRAFYLLFRQSWRARICQHCGAYFIANRPNQPFCGTVCSSEVARARKRHWWRKNGERWRKRKLVSAANQKR